MKTGESGRKTNFFLDTSRLLKLSLNSDAMWETWVGKIPWGRERLPTPVFWPGEFTKSQI